jgi:hypothetical protein
MSPTVLYRLSTVRQYAASCWGDRPGQYAFGRVRASSRYFPQIMREGFNWDRWV